MNSSWRQQRGNRIELKKRNLILTRPALLVESISYNAVVVWYGFSFIGIKVIIYIWRVYL